MAERVIVVVHTQRAYAIRIISMRKANEREQKYIISDLKRIDKMNDSDIDYSDIPELDESFFDKTIITLPHKKDSVTLRLDHEVLEYFKHGGPKYQTRINAVLRAYVDAQRRADK